MKNSKKLFLIFLSVLIVTFVSCKKDSSGSITNPTPTFKPSSLLGSWTFDGDTSTAGNNTLKVEDNTITVRLNGVDATIDTSATWNDEKDKEVTVYQKSSEETYKGAVGKATHTVKFTSATTCSASLTTEKSGNFNANFKKQQ